MLLHSLLLVSALSGAPVPLIIDTDLGFDVDDVGAISVGNHLADIGECQLLGVVHNTGFYYGIGGVDVPTHYYGRDYNKSVFNLGAYTGPWGSSQQAQNNQNKYTTKIEQDFPSQIQNYNQTVSAVAAYTTMLYQAEDASVVIASIGELTNLRDIITSNKALFIQKVKSIYYMDAPYNFGCGAADSSGWSPYLGNASDCDGSAQYVVENVPKAIKQVFTLNGGAIATGGRFNNGCGQGPVKEAYQIYTNYGTRASWDPITVYLAVMGDTSLYSSLQSGTIHVDYYGNEKFDTTNTSNNQYHAWIDASHNDDVVGILDEILCAAPCLSPTDLYGGCASYQLNSVRNCYTSNGATDLEKPVGSCAGTMSLYDCQTMCDKTDECTGITVTVSNNNTANAGYVDCYRRSNIQIGDCESDNRYDTYTKKSWKRSAKNANK